MRYPFLLVLALMFVHLSAGAQCNIDNVVIKALLIDPSGSEFNFDTNGDGLSNSADEFIEICNESPTDAIDISGWKLGDDDPLPFPDFVIPDGSFLLPGDCVLLVHDYCPDDGPDQSVSSCDVPDGVIDMNSSQTSILGNSGDVITLVKADESASCSVTYGNVQCSDVDPIDSPFFDANFCEYWGVDTDGCSLLADGVGCNYVPSILPIQLVELSAYVQDRGEVVLEWITASEIMSEKFEIEWRSEFEHTFKRIGETPASGHSQAFQNYNFKHTAPPNGINYYRLKQLDYDGNFYYSHIVAAQVKGSDKLRIYPNLVSDGIHINGYADQYFVSLYSISGEQLIDKKTVVNRAFIDLSSLQSGYYIVRIFDGQDIITKRIIKT